MFAENYFGVMQGRLLPKYKGRYQAHPVNYWQDEFRIANEIGLDCIEFILSLLLRIFLKFEVISSLPESIISLILKKKFIV